MDLNRADKTFSGKLPLAGEAKAEAPPKGFDGEAVEVAGQARPFTLDNDNEALYAELASTGLLE